MKPPEDFLRDFHLLFADMDVAVGIVNLPEFLSYHLAQPIKFPDTFSSPRRFTSKDFHEPWFGPAEIARVNDFKNLKRQLHWMGGRIAVKQLVLRLIDPARHARSLEIHHEPMGAPFLPSFPHLSISIAHSGIFAVAAMGLKDGYRVGVDIEACRCFDMNGVIETVFSPREQSILGGSSLSEFYRLWTLKEAFLKLLRKGFSEEVKSVEILGDRIYYEGLMMDRSRILTRLIGIEYIFSMVYTRALPERHGL